MGAYPLLLMDKVIAYQISGLQFDKPQLYTLRMAGQVTRLTDEVHAIRKVIFHCKLHGEVVLVGGETEGP